MNCDKCKNKPWRECSDNCKEIEYHCYVCANVVKVIDYIEHLGKHYNDKSLYLTCCMCRVNKHISDYRFRKAKCRLCIYLHRYRHIHTKDRFEEYVKRFNIKV